MGNPSGLSEAEIRAISSASNIKYLGESDDVRIQMANTDCVVLPSYKEGMPRVLMEAAAMAIPSIASNIPGCRDLVVNNFTGFLFEPGQPKDLARVMLAFLNLSHDEGVANKYVDTVTKAIRTQNGKLL